MTDAFLTGAGISTMSTKPTEEGAADLALVAVRRALDDAGRTLSEVDGLLINRSEVPGSGSISLGLASQLGLMDLTVLLQLECHGATAGVMLAQAFDIVRSGVARVVVGVFADAPLVEDRPAGSAFAQYVVEGEARSLERASGLLGAVPAYALAASRYEARFGLAPEDLGAVAVSTRAWARGNPDAVARDPLTLAQHSASRLVATPLRLFDCARPVNGAAAFVVSRDHGADSPSVVLVATGSSHPVRRRLGPAENWLDEAPIPAGNQAFDTAGMGRDDVDVIEVYDPFTIVPLDLLEGYGFCSPGNAAEWFRDGVTAPGGARPVNTGGGQLSGWYLQGMTPIFEALVQLRGRGSDRQVPGAQTAFVATMGGRFGHHVALILERAS